MTKSTTPVVPNLDTFQPKHLQLLTWGADPAVRNILAAGGIRSGKTIALTTLMFLRAQRAPGSTHGFFHATRTSCERNLFQGTFPETLDILLPGWFSALSIDKQNYVNKADLTVRLPNGSKFIFMGLDDPEKVRGLKFSTIFLNEANFVDYKTVMTLRGRLSENIDTIDGLKLETKMLFDLNPTVKSSWDYRAFVEGVIPGEVGDRPLPNHSKRYRWLTINAIDNKPNLPDSIFEDFEAMTEEQRRRDEHGMWSEDNPNALFDLTKIGRKTIDPEDLILIVVSVDPAGSDSATADMTGIVVQGMDHAGNFYILEDATMKGKPEEWAQRAVDLYHKYSADYIIAEKNYGGQMVETVLSRATIGGSRIPIKLVTARRGKRLRAEPIQVLYERGLVNHVKPFRELEQQMIEFDSPGFKGSPDRVDALVWGLTFLSEQGTAPSPGTSTNAPGFWR